MIQRLHVLLRWSSQCQQSDVLLDLARPIDNVDLNSSSIELELSIEIRAQVAYVVLICCLQARRLFALVSLGDLDRTMLAVWEHNHQSLAVGFACVLSHPSSITFSVESSLA